jgi:hypothetical protein
MTIDHPVRRWLARVCSPETMARVVDPTLADMRVETGRPAWLGYLALVRALAVHGVVSMPSRARHVWRDDEHAIPRLMILSLTAAFVTALPLVLMPMLSTGRTALLGPIDRIIPRSARTAEIFLLLLPQAMALTLPAALLVGVPLAMRGVRVTARIRRRAIGLLILFAVLTGVVIDRIMPRTNQTFRVLVSGQPVPPGTNETTFAGLRREMAGLKTFHGGEAGVRRIEYTIHLRMALISASLPLGLLALALTATRFGRRRPWLVAMTGLACYLVVLLPLMFVAQNLMKRTTLPPSLLAWFPMITIAVLALTIQRRASGGATEACA